MTELMENETWKKFLNRHVSLLKEANSRRLFYRGVIVAVLDNKIILKDRKLGEIPLSFDGLSLIDVGENNDS